MRINLPKKALPYTLGHPTVHIALAIMLKLVPKHVYTLKQYELSSVFGIKIKSLNFVMQLLSSRIRTAILTGKQLIVE